MAAIVITTNHWKYQLGKKQVDISTDTFKAVLMNGSFAFDKDAHATYADISSFELASGGGYTAGGATLSGGTFTEDDANDRAYRTFDNVQWTPVDAGFGPTSGVCIVDTSTADNTVVGCFDFGSDFTYADGMKFTLEALTISINE